MNTPPIDLDVRHSPERSRYELFVDGQLSGVVEYHEHDPATLVLPHTEVSPALRGKGFSEPFLARALEDVRARGLRVVPACWYVAQFLDTHPDFADLRSAEG